jgi:hypothetical protein
MSVNGVDRFCAPCFLTDKQSRLNALNVSRSAIGCEDASMHHEETSKRMRLSYKSEIG